MDVETTQEKFVSRFGLSEEEVIYGMCTWIQNSDTLFELQIHRGNASWSGLFSTAFAKQFCEVLDEERIKYYESVKMALKGDNSCYIYDMIIMPEGKTGTFNWKKNYEDGSCFIHGSVPLHLDDIPTPTSVLIDLLINQSKVLKDTIKVLTTKSISSEEDCENAKQELAQFISVKTSLEKSLYSKFLQILNTKKRRIKILEEHLNNFPSKEIIDESNLV